jgi:hypothetical protein
MSILGRVVRRLIGSADILRAVLRGTEKVDGIEVHGRQEFIRAVTKALFLLRAKKLPAWDTLSQHVDSIFEGRRTTALVTAHPAFMFVDGPHSGQDPEFLAGTIAYLARSCQLHRAYEAEHPGRRVPRDVYLGSAALERCDKAYRECLLALEVAPERIQSLKGSNGK